MIRKLSELLKKYDKSLLLAAGMSMAFFVHFSFDYWRSGPLAVDVFLRIVAASTILFVLLFVLLFGIIRALVADVRRELLQQGGDAKADRGEVRTLALFALLKALVRCVVGVSLILVWLAGVFSVLERHAGGERPLGLLLAAVYSVVIFLLAFGFVSFMDRIRFPQD